MQHIKVTFGITEEVSSDMIVAMLAGIGYSGFEELEDQLLAYVEEKDFNPQDLVDVAQQCGADFHTEVVGEQNWNALWESNFQPVIVDDFCTIRAHFHDITVSTPYEIIITPKMSFGTGHHATTQLVMLMMKELSFSGKSVLDFGTGTGVLAILAEMLGAGKVLAIDNDEWSVTNAVENCGRNGCKRITVANAGTEGLPSGKYEIILANINRHILLHYMQDLAGTLADDGTIIMSGLLAGDKEIILNAATAAGFRPGSVREKDGWIAISFIHNA